MQLFTVRGILFDKAIVNSAGILFRIMQLLTVRGIFVYEVTVVYTVVYIAAWVQFAHRIAMLEYLLEQQKWRRR